MPPVNEILFAWICCDELRDEQCIVLVINPSVVITDALFKWLELMVEAFNVFKLSGSLVPAILVMVVTPAEVDKAIPEPACIF